MFRLIHGTFFLVHYEPYSKHCIFHRILFSSARVRQGIQTQETIKEDQTVSQDSQM
jgi:hypothetical protein